MSQQFVTFPKELLGFLLGQCFLFIVLLDERKLILLVQNRDGV